jgi:hypothetical protein
MLTIIHHEANFQLHYSPLHVMIQLIYEIAVYELCTAHPHINLDSGMRPTH